MRWLALVVAVVVSTRVAHASDATARIKDGFVAAGATYAGVVFDDPACKRAFGSHGKVPAAQRKRFGTCLRGLLDHGSESAAMDAKTETIDLTTPTHGFELVFTCGKHQGTCYSFDAELTSVRAYDKQGATAAASKQIADPTIELTDAIKAGMAKRKLGQLSATVHACFDDSGKYHGSYVSRDSGISAFDDAAARAVPPKITPYKIDGVAVPFCVELEFRSR